MEVRNGRFLPISGEEFNLGDVKTKHNNKEKYYNDSILRNHLPLGNCSWYFSVIQPAVHTTTEEKITVRRNVGGISCIANGWRKDYRCECKINK